MNKTLFSAGGGRLWPALVLSFLSYGAKDANGTRGIGTAAIRCMRTDHSDIIIEGFTLRDGATFVIGNSTLADGGGLLTTLFGQDQT